MLHNITHMGRENAILSNLEENMPVYDVNNRRIGRIGFIHFGEGPETIEAPQQPFGDPVDNFVELVSELVARKQHLPYEIRARLLQHGFAAVNVRPISRTYFFMPEHIKSINDGAVYLNIPKREVICM